MIGGTADFNAPAPRNGGFKFGPSFNKPNSLVALIGNIIDRIQDGPLVIGVDVINFGIIHFSQDDDHWNMVRFHFIDELVVGRRLTDHQNSVESVFNLLLDVINSIDAFNG